MKYFQELSLLQVFNKSNLDKITGSSEISKQILKNYVKKKSIKKITYNYYGVIDFSSGDLLADKFMIGSKISKDSFISHRSAFEFYGYYNQLYTYVYVSSISKFKSFDFNELTFEYLPTKHEEQVEIVRGIKVSSIERTIVDSIKDLDKISDLEEILKCIDLVSYIEENKILGYLETINQKLLYKKIGYILTFFQDKLKLSNHFFNVCKEKGEKVLGYFSQVDKEILVYDSTWNFYAYSSAYIKQLTSKGEYEGDV